MKFVWLSFFIVSFVWSAINPKDHFTWFLEVAPALIGFMLLILTYKKFPLTPLLYALILIHMIILMVGGHYTYA
jgi:putative membrane protein